MLLIGREEILKHVPHAGRMCLIDEVASWDAGGIVCSARNHTRTDHPLRRFSHISSLHLIEYGAQAMAIHGALLEHECGSKPQPGMLVAVRAFTATVANLETLDGPLEIHARPELARSGALIYAFRCVHGSTTIASGRVTVMLATPPSTSVAS